MTCRRSLAFLAVFVAAVVPGTALAEFPYPTAPSNPGDFTQYKVGDQTPSDLAGKLDWMYSATPESPGSPPQGRRRGARRVSRGIYVGTRGRGGRLVYGVRRGRVTFVAVTPRNDARKTAALGRRLRALGLRRR